MKTVYRPALAIALLASCQSCRSNPPPQAPVDSGVSDPGVDAGSIAMGDSGVLDAQAAIIDSSSPPDECLSKFLGPAGASFCKSGDGGVLPVAYAIGSPSARGSVPVISPSNASHVLFVFRYSNRAAKKMKPVVVLLNRGTASTLTFVRRGVAGPTMDAVGGEQLAVDRWKSSSVKVTSQVPAGKAFRFDVSLEVGMPPSYTMIGLYEMFFDQPYSMRACLLEEKDSWTLCEEMDR